MRPRPTIILAVLLLITAACGDKGARIHAHRSTTTSAPNGVASTTTSLAAIVDSAATGSTTSVAGPSARATTTGPQVTTQSPTTTSSATKPDLAKAHVRATRVGSLSEPVAMAWRAGDSAAYVAERGGRVRTLAGQTVLDLTSAVTTTGSEQGLLGLAFAADGAHLYVDYTDTNGDTRIAEYAFRSGRADVTTRRQLLFVKQPFPNHNGGQLVVTADGLLWIGLGDGGSAGDPANNAQNLGTLLGKVLRIDPRPSGTQPYTVPRDNPFVGRTGARPEIWAFGLRNPWRFTFDRSTGDLWIGDVGQNAWEEVDFRAAASRGGENYGWSQVEGTHFFKGPAPAGSVPPIYEYATQSGCAVTGGYVYRGSKTAALRGAYVFGDFCNGDVLGLVHGASGTSVRSLGAKVSNLSSFAQDPAGELYALSLSGGVFRLDPA